MPHRTTATDAGPLPGSPAPALAVRGLRRSYGRREVVRGLSLTAARGELTAVLGPNGAGKTTTIECCEGLRRPDAGTIEVLGVDRTGPWADAYLRERVGVMLQDGGLPLAPRAEAVLAHVARLHAHPIDPGALLERLGLSDVARTSVRRLSGGQRQRLALAAAVIGRPELVFLDEPSAGLDPQSRLAVRDLLRELRAGGTSLVLTTHLMTEAEELADHVVIIDAGQVVADGTPAELTGGTRVRVTPAAGDSSAALGVALTAALAGHRTLTVASGPGWVDVTAEQPVPAESAPAHVSAGTSAGHASAEAPEAPGAPSARTPTARASAEAPAARVSAETSGIGAGTLAVVASAVAAAGHGDADVSLHRRTLEDTFLDLTGRALRDGEEQS